MGHFMGGLGIVNAAPLVFVEEAFQCFIATATYYILGALFIRGGVFLRISTGLALSTA